MPVARSFESTKRLRSTHDQTFVARRRRRRPLASHYRPPYSTTNMLSPQSIVLEYICPALGAVTANVMFASPTFSVKDALRRGSLEELNPTPWAFMLGNTAGWVLYGILINNWFVFWGNVSREEGAERSGFCTNVLRKGATAPSSHRTIIGAWTYTFGMVQSLGRQTHL